MMGKPCIYSQYYLSPDHEGDHKQVEYLRNLILNESEKFYHKQIEELTNMAISEAAAHDNNQSSLTSNEKQSIGSDEDLAPEPGPVNFSEPGNTTK
ncbi:MAG: hypothetical protein WA395_03410 [Nitrososphaeraceae archaeon]